MNKTVVLYSTGCPKCGVLKRKLDESGIEYDTVTDVDEMKRLGMSNTPVLMTDGELLEFGKAIEWVRSKMA